MEGGGDGVGGGGRRRGVGVDEKRPGGRGFDRCVIRGGLSEAILRAQIIKSFPVKFDDDVSGP